MIEDLKTLLWFLRRPSFYATMVALIIRKFLKNKDREEDRQHIWCNERKTTLEACFSNLGLEFHDSKPFKQDYLAAVQKKIDNSTSNFGGKGHIDLLFNICESLEVTEALETGVAYGWSSEAILRSLSKRSGRLISVDMPMLKQDDYELIGVAVEDSNLQYWDLIRKPDKYGLKEAIRKLNYSYDLAHYDSDKSYYGRKWSQPIIWKHLKPGGVFISDDIEDNSAFREFVEEEQLDFHVFEFEGKYVGIVKK